MRAHLSRYLSDARACLDFVSQKIRLPQVDQLRPEHPWIVSRELCKVDTSLAARSECSRDTRQQGRNLAIATRFDVHRRRAASCLSRRMPLLERVIGNDARDPSHLQVDAPCWPLSGVPTSVPFVPLGEDRADRREMSRCRRRRRWPFPGSSHGGARDDKTQSPQNYSPNLFGIAVSSDVRRKGEDCGLWCFVRGLPCF